MGRYLYGRKTIKSFSKTGILSLLFLTIICSGTQAQYKPLGFEGVSSPKVEALRNKYLTTHRQWLYNILEDAELYRIYVRSQLEQRKMPAILEYLPVVESNYIPTAKSKSGAAGMWQFMLNSIKPFLHCDEYVDERLDPWKSTDAALSKLKENYDMFGDWLLAITAYNCGAGAMKRAIKKAGNSNFWYLAGNGFLSEQAAGYVPKLLAVADTVENANYYGIEMPQARNRNGKTIDIRAGHFDYVTIKKSISIRLIASELRIDEPELTRLNLALIQGCTPPDREYNIRLPEGTGISMEYLLKQIEN